MLVVFWPCLHPNAADRTLGIQYWNLASNAEWVHSRQPIWPYVATWWSCSAAEVQGCCAFLPASSGLVQTRVRYLEGVSRPVASGLHCRDGMCRESMRYRRVAWRPHLEVVSGVRFPETGFVRLSISRVYSLEPNAFGFVRWRWRSF